MRAPVGVAGRGGGLTTTAAAQPYVFVLGGDRAGGAVDHAKPLGARRGTKVVQAVLKRQARARVGYVGDARPAESVGEPLFLSYHFPTTIFSLLVSVAHH